MIFGKLAWRNIGRNRTRSLVFMGAALLGFAMALFTLNTMKSISRQRLNDAINIQTSDLQIHKKGFMDDREITFTIPNAQGLITMLRQTPGVGWVSKRLAFNAVVASPENSVVGEIKGVVPADENKITVLNDFLIAGDMLNERQRLPILVSQKTAEKLKLKLNGKLVLTLKSANGELTGGMFRVVGVFATPSTPFDESTFIARFDDLAALAGLDAPHELAIKLYNPAAFNAVKTQIQQKLPSDCQIDDWKFLLPELAAFDGFINMVGVLTTIIIILGLGFSLMNTMNMIIQERTPEIGMLRAIGQTRWSVFLTLITEGLLMMLIGALGGILLGTVFIKMANIWGIPMSNGLESLGIRPVVYPEFDVSLLTMVLFIALVLTILISIIPASKVWRLQTAEALKQ
jgi:putative ABC transport system permease protein